MNITGNPVGYIRRTALLLSVGLIAAVSSAAAARVDARLDSTRIHIGDRVRLTLTAQTAPGETVRFPDLATHLDSLELLAELPAERVAEEGGGAVVRRSFLLTSFHTGRLELGGLPFAVMDSAGEVDTLHSADLSLEVLSLVPDTTGADIRPLRSLVAVPPLWRDILLWAGVALAALTALVLLWRRYLRGRSRRLERSAAPPAPALPPHERALRELERIKSLGLIEKGEIKQFHFLVSDTVRIYLHGRYGIEAPEMTTWELNDALASRSDIPPAAVDLIRDFLEACDLVKFAKYKPRVVEINSAFNQAIEIVESTKEAPPPPPPEGDGGEQPVSAASGEEGGR